MMQLLNTIQNTAWKEYAGEYFMRISNYNELIRDPLFLSQDCHNLQNIISGHIAYHTSDPYNQFGDHILVYDESDLKLIGSARVIAMRNIEHLKPLGGLYCQGFFDISSIVNLHSNMVELSKIFINPECENKSEVLLKLWNGVFELVQEYDAQYVIGTLAFPMHTALQDIENDALFFPENLILNMEESPVWARNHLKVKKLSSGQDLISCDLLEICNKLSEIHAKVGQEVHVENHHINLFILADASEQPKKEVLYRRLYRQSKPCLIL
ncbi:MAG: GNAT family N-acetyltransferase [Mariprofundaceae bacterium]|nr:GNAT family N-acetyltransferase [Mariprofundaceae bacterium]